MNRFLSCLLALAIFPCVAGADDEEIMIESARLHLGKPGQWEWDIFKDLPVDAERFERRFQAKANLSEESLRIWQRDVKLNWTVLLNDRKLGTLVNAETALECLLAVPPAFLRGGENRLVIEPPAGLDDIVVGPVSLVGKPVAEFLAGARVDVSVSDQESGQPIPCRLTLTRPDGTLQPLRAGPEDKTASRVGVVYTSNGRASLLVPAGDYVLHAGRGFEWSVDRKEISLTREENQPIALTLTREVSTEGWIAADSHIHTLTHSGHGDASVNERVLTIAGEGIELAIATDHNHHADYAPAALGMGVIDRFTPIIGNEVTTKRGHFNVFPIEAGAAVVDHQEEDWSRLIPAIRKTPGVKVITLNHPRDVHSGFIPLGGFQFNPETGRHRQAAALDIDAMEVVTSAAMQSDIHLLYRDWFALLNRGAHRIAAIASSDSHDVNRFILGQGRTYVAVDNRDPAQLDLGQVWRSYEEGRLLVSLGLLTHVKVDDRFTVGELATGLSGTIKVEATVLGPSWAKADHLALYANGIKIREEKLQDNDRAGEKARIIWHIEKPVHDVHLVVIATGPGITEPFWEIPRPYQPSSKTLNSRVIGSTNPIWLDADDDGIFQSAFAYARQLIRNHGSDREKLREALKGYDASVSVQVGSLTGSESE